MYINVQKDYGRAYGFNCELFDSKFNSFIEKHNLNLSEPLKKLIMESLSSNLTLLNHIEIKSEYKNQGLGSNLLQEFIKSANSCVLLVSDENASNNFDLTKWYEKQGFQIITDTKYGPLMFKIS